MIDVFTKLSLEGRLPSSGHLLDLGCGNGIKDKPFASAGFAMTLVDKSEKSLAQARETLAGMDSISYVQSTIESFNFTDMYDGILAINSLPFLNDTELIGTTIRTSYQHLNAGGFLHFTLFGVDDEWVDDMSMQLAFFSMEEARSILPVDPYYVSEDKGIGGMMSGGTKRWHILHFLYIKE